MALLLTPEMVTQTTPFNLLPQYEKLIFRSIDHDSCVILEGKNGDVHELHAVQTIVRKDEADIWHACNQMVQFHVGETKQILKGSFSFELVSIEMFTGLEASDWGHLHTVIVKTAQKLNPGDTRLITYRSLRGVLSMRMPLDWGKITSSHAVRVFEKPVEKIDLYIKKLLKRSENRYIIIHDISREAIIDPANKEQEARCRRLFTHSNDTQAHKPTIIYAHCGTSIIINDHFTPESG